MDEKTLAYLAGLIDGEGCLTIKCNTKISDGKYGAKSPYFVAEIRVRMCDPRALYLMQRTFTCSMRYEARKNPNHRAIYTLYASAQRARTIVTALLPYLIIKREEAQVFLDFFTHCYDPFPPRAAGFARKPTPAWLITRRHTYRLKLQELKRHNWDQAPHNHLTP